MMTSTHTGQPAGRPGQPLVAQSYCSECGGANLGDIEHHDALCSRRAELPEWPSGRREATAQKVAALMALGGYRGRRGAAALVTALDTLAQEVHAATMRGYRAGIERGYRTGLERGKPAS